MVEDTITDIYELKRECREVLQIDVENGFFIAQIGNDNVVMECPKAGYGTVKNIKNHIKISVDRCKSILNLFYNSEYLYLNLDNSKGEIKNIDVDYLYVELRNSTISFDNTFIKNLDVNSLNSVINGNVNLAINSDIFFKLENSKLNLKINSDKHIGFIVRLYGNPEYYAIASRKAENNVVIRIESDDKSRIEVT
ncbi:MAG: hypothetical protein OWQ54_04925 [Sulfolobaceae archaeon]|nr:hypothetical protein [Sulfolobaceae archaeon]